MKLFEDHLANVVVLGSWSCWRLSTHKKTGYVSLGIKHKTYKAHRIFYATLISSIPRNLTLDHLCRHRWCCNPDHLEPVTQKVNNLRGNSLSAKNARKTKCHRGHPFLLQNTWVDRHGNRHCKKCNADNQKHRRARKILMSDKNRSRRARNICGLSVKQAAHLLGVGHEYLTQLEEAEKIDTEMLPKLVSLYSVRKEWLTGEVPQHDYSAVDGMRGAGKLTSHDRDAVAEFAAFLRRDKKPKTLEEIAKKYEGK